MRQPQNISSYLAAAALALVTIFTFYVFQDFGPQSVIRRFHMAVAHGDQETIDRITNDPTADKSYTKYVTAFVSRIMNSDKDVTFQISDIRRSKKDRNKVQVAITYQIKNRMTGALWYVDQGRHDWKIDAMTTETWLWEHSIREPPPSY
jgi:hypothetical protein